MSGQAWILGRHMTNDCCSRAREQLGSLPCYRATSLHKQRLCTLSHTAETVCVPSSLGTSLALTSQFAAPPEEADKAALTA